MKGFLLLCDYAEELNGKLYIMGGGFSRLFAVRPAFDLSVAGKLLVPWVRTNERLTISMVLMNDDGEVVKVGDDQTEVRLTTQMEVGRPPGLPHGTEIDVPLVWRLEQLPLPIGRYRWELKVDDDHVADTVMDVVKP